MLGMAKPCTFPSASGNRRMFTWASRSVVLVVLVRIALRLKAGPRARVRIVCKPLSCVKFNKSSCVRGTRRNATALETVESQFDGFALGMTLVVSNRAVERGNNLSRGESLDSVKQTEITHLP